MARQEVVMRKMNANKATMSLVTKQKIEAQKKDK